MKTIPPFDSLEVELWFSIFESSMFVQRILEEETKYHLLVCLLPPKVNKLKWLNKKKDFGFRTTLIHK